mgnify:CR=1 FL=1
MKNQSVLKEKENQSALKEKGKWKCTKCFISNSFNKKNNSIHAICFIPGVIYPSLVCIVPYLVTRSEWSMLLMLTQMLLMCSKIVLMHSRLVEVDHILTPRKWGLTIM